MTLARVMALGSWYQFWHMVHIYLGTYILADQPLAGGSVAFFDPWHHGLQCDIISPKMLQLLKIVALSLHIWTNHVLHIVLQHFSLDISSTERLATD